MDALNNAQGKAASTMFSPSASLCSTEGGKDSQERTHVHTRTSIGQTKTYTGQTQGRHRTDTGQPQDRHRTGTGQPPDSLQRTSAAAAAHACAKTDT